MHQEEFEDTKREVIRIRISKKNRWPKEPEALKSMYRSRSLEGPLFFMPIGNPRWLPPQVIVLTQNHMGKIQKYILL
jgi:hypothetical protein